MPSPLGFGACPLGNIVSGVFTPVLAKHTKHLSLAGVLSIGIDRIQRNFESMKKQVETWKATRLPDETAKLVIYRAFVEGELDVPKHLARRVHDLYFNPLRSALNPQVDEFAPRTTWSLSNAFTSALKELETILQFKATAKLASFLEASTAELNSFSNNAGIGPHKVTRQARGARAFLAGALANRARRQYRATIVLSAAYSDFLNYSNRKCRQGSPTKRFQSGILFGL